MINNVILYISTVLIWGTTWIGIKLQIGYATAEISVLYRGMLATALLLAWCKIKNFNLRFKVRDHIFLCALGLSMFSLHILFIFHAMHHIVSGIVAVVFSGVSFFCILNNYIFFRIRPSPNVILGVLIGFSGLFIFFWDEIANISLQKNTLRGFMLAGIGAIIFSFGSSISKRNHNEGLEIVPSITIGMMYGTLAILIYTFTQSNNFILPDSATYWLSLVYLASIGSIVAFLCYIKLIKNVGPALASYTTVLFPVIALIVSWAIEGYECSTTDFLGFSLVVLGNIFVITKKPLLKIYSYFITKDTVAPEEGMLL